MSLRHVAQTLRYDGVHGLPYGVEQPDRPVRPGDGVVVLALLSQHHCGRFFEMLWTVAELEALVEDRH